MNEHEWTCIFKRTRGHIITTNCSHVKLNAIVWRLYGSVLLQKRIKKCFSVPLFMELHAESCPGPVGNRRGGEVMPWWLIMWPSSFSPPPPGERLEITLRAMFLDCPLFHFLYLKMFSAPVQTHSYSSAAVCPQSPSSYTFFPPSSASSVPTAGPLCPLHKIPLVSLRRAFRSGTQNLLDKKKKKKGKKTVHLPAGHIFKDYAWWGVSGCLHCAPLAAHFSQSLSLKQPLRVSSPYCPRGYKLLLCRILMQGASTQKLW